jgi:hypothetical protein
VNLDGAIPPPEASIFQPGNLNPRLARRSTAEIAVAFTIPLDLDVMTARFKTYATRHSMTVAFALYGASSG